MPGTIGTSSCGARRGSIPCCRQASARCAVVSPSRSSTILSPLLCEVFLEPVMCVRLIVEGLDLHVSGGAVQRDGFAERIVCFEPNHPTAVACSLRLELGKQTPADAETARRVCDPHALELCGLLGVELQRPAADWLRAESCD